MVLNIWMFGIDKPISGVFQFSFLDLELHHSLMVLLCLFLQILCKFVFLQAFWVYLDA